MVSPPPSPVRLQINTSKSLAPRRVCAQSVCVMGEESIFILFPSRHSNPHTFQQQIIQDQTPEKPKVQVLVRAAPPEHDQLDHLRALHITVPISSSVSYRCPFTHFSSAAYIVAPLYRLYVLTTGDQKYREKRRRSSKASAVPVRCASALPFWYVAVKSEGESGLYCTSATTLVVRWLRWDECTLQLTLVIGARTRRVF